VLSEGKFRRSVLEDRVEQTVEKLLIEADRDLSFLRVNGGAENEQKGDSQQR
jgi:hypothetical protein